MATTGSDARIKIVDDRKMLDGKFFVLDSEDSSDSELYETTKKKKAPLKKQFHGIVQKINRPNTQIDNEDEGEDEISEEESEKNSSKQSQKTTTQSSP
jgi:ERCC4-related helicase